MVEYDRFCFKLKEKTKYIKKKKKHMIIEFVRIIQNNYWVTCQPFLNH